MHLINNPKISVLTSCYNAARFLPDAIESILSQTFRDFEFILIDDGSTDETLGIIKRYAAEDERIIVIKKANSGLADSLNAGIKEARGEWIARLDADDVALPSRLEKQLNLVRRFPRVVLVGSGCIVIDQSGKKIKVYKYPSGKRALIKRMIKGGSSFPHSTAFYRVDAVRRLGGYRPRIYRAEDKDLWLRLSRLGEIESLYEPLIKLRKHSESITAKDVKCAITSYAAMISFLMVREGIRDPVEESDETYQHFLSWIEKRLTENGYLERSREWSKLREEWQQSTREPLFAKILQLLKKLICSPHSVNIIKDKLFGLKMPIKLTKEWMKINNSLKRKQISNIGHM